MEQTPNNPVEATEGTSPPTGTAVTHLPHHVSSTLSAQFTVPSTGGTAAAQKKDLPLDNMTDTTAGGGSATDHSPTGPGGIPLPPTTNSAGSTCCQKEFDEPPLLSNASMALAEFASLLRPAESKNYLKEHIISLLDNVDREDTLVRLAKELERNASPKHSNHDGDEGISSRLSPATTVSESTAVTGSSINNRGMEGFGGHSFHKRCTSSVGSASVPLNIEESILRTQLEHQTVQQQNAAAAAAATATATAAGFSSNVTSGGSGARGGQTYPYSARRSHRYSAVSLTTEGSDGVDGAASSFPDDDRSTSPVATMRRRSHLGAAALGLNLFNTVFEANTNSASDAAGTDTYSSRPERHGSLSREARGDDDGDDDGGTDHEDGGGSSVNQMMVDPLEGGGAVANIPDVVRREGRRVAVSAAPCALGAVRQYVPRVVPKSAAEQRQLRHVVKGCHLFANLEEKDVEEVVQAMERETYPAGACVLEQGQDTRDCLFLITEGSCEAIKNGKVIGGVGLGGVFGELELMYKQAKCAATIRCITRCTIYTLDEESYRHAVMTGALQKRQKYEELTRQVPFLKCLPDYERMKIAEALGTKAFRRGQYVIRFGTKGTHLYFIVEGEVKVIGRNQGKKVEVVRLRTGDVVGELEFLFNHLTVADVVVASRRLVTACISRQHFEMILGPIQERLKEFVATSSTYESYYLKQVADASVRSEISRAGDVSQRKRRRRVATPGRGGGGGGDGATPDGTAGTSGADDKGNRAGNGEGVGLTDLDPRGEIILPAKRSLLTHFTTADLLDDKERIGSTPADEIHAGAGNISTQQQQLSVSLAGADVGENPLLFRFPLFPINTSNETIILGLREDGVVLSWNDNMAKLTSYTAEEVVGQNIYSFLLESHDQQVMYQAISDARSYAGDVDGFFADAGLGKHRKYTFARSDGLTRAVVRLSVIPPLVSSGEDGADMVLAFGDEIKQCPHQIVDPSQWLASQLRAILADGTHTYEDRLQLVADAVNSYEATYRALTMSTEKLRVVNIRQMVGQVMMDFGAECVHKGLGVRQRFEGLETERAYLDAELLPECLRFAMGTCIGVAEASLITITVTLMEKNGLEFLVVNFNVDGEGFSPECVPILEMPLTELTTQQLSGEEEKEKSRSTMATGEEGGTGGGGSDVDLMKERKKDKNRLTYSQKQQLRRVREVVEEQGGTMRVQRNDNDSNMFFLIPFIPASAEEAENASVAESISNAHPTSSASTSCAGLGATTADVNAAASDAPLLAEPAAAATLQPAYNFTTLVAEDTPAHRNMLCSYLWERRHAVLPAYSLPDIDRLTGVADILIIDLHQSIIGSLTTQDPIALLREKARHMAVVITAKSFDDVTAAAYHAAGFITLRKPCTPVQAMQAIHKAEEKIFAHKHEAERIAQARETLAKNSRGAWRRGRLLGKGSFGEVFEAIDVLTGGKMAVKEMHLGKDNKRIEMFVEEVATMCNLQHPNIIHYFYCEQSSDLNVIRVFMEFAAGGTLQGLLSQKGKLPFKEFQSLLRDVTEGLAYIHSQHYVHCDIKTANVLLSHEGTGKIGDFGTARTLRNGEKLYDMQGSPLYMSPECMAAGDLDEDGQRIGFSFATDVWSLGCVALEMVTNKPPFSHIKRFNGPAGFTNYITSLTDTPDLSPLFDGPPSIVEFVSACLNPDPARRPTAHELLQMSVFSEATDEDTKSAVQALRRAQLLHVLNKFIAFEEPEDAEARLHKDLKYKTYRRDYCDFFQSSRSPSSTSKDGDVRNARKAAAAGSQGEGSGRGSSDSDDEDESSSSSDSDEDMMMAVRLPGAGGDKSKPNTKVAHALQQRGGAVPACAKSSSSSSSRASGSGSPAPARPSGGTEDVSPTPKKRSKTLSKPPLHAASAPRMNMASPTRRMALADSDDEAAEAAFFASSSAASSHEADGDGSTQEEVAKKATSSPPSVSIEGNESSDMAHPTTGKEAADGNRRMGSRREEEGPARRNTTAAPTAAVAAGGSEPSPRATRRPAGVSNTSLTPLLAASSLGRGAAAVSVSTATAPAPSSVGGAGGGTDLSATGKSLSSVVSAALASAAAQPLSAANLNQNMSFFHNASFTRNVSFMGANMDEVLNNAANDLMQNLAAAPSETRLHPDTNNANTNRHRGAGSRKSTTQNDSNNATVSSSRDNTSTQLWTVPTPLPVSPPLTAAADPQNSGEAGSVSFSISQMTSTRSIHIRAVTEQHDSLSTLPNLDAAAATTVPGDDGGTRPRRQSATDRETRVEATSTSANAEEFDLTRSGAPELPMGMSTFAGGATVMSAGHHGGKNGNPARSSSSGGERARSPSPLPTIPACASGEAADPVSWTTNTPTTVSSSRLLDAVEVDRGGTTSRGSSGGGGSSSRSRSGSSSGSSSPADSAETSSSASGTDVGRRGRRAHRMDTTLQHGIEDINDVRLKIARKLRKAHDKLSNRSFFRIEDLTGPLANSINTSSSHRTGLLGNARDSYSSRPQTRSQTGTTDGHTQDHCAAPAALTPQHAQASAQAQRAPSEVRAESNRSASEAAGAGVSAAMLAAVLRSNNRIGSLSRGSPDTPLSRTSGNFPTACGAAVVATQPVATRWLDAAVLGNPIFRHHSHANVVGDNVPSDDESFTAPSTNFISALSGDFPAISSAVGTTPAPFLSTGTAFSSGNSAVAEPYSLPAPTSTANIPDEQQRQWHGKNLMMDSASHTSTQWGSPQLYQASSSGGGSFTHPSTAHLPAAQRQQSSSAVQVSTQELVTVESTLNDIARHLKQMMGSTPSPGKRGEPGTARPSVSALLPHSTVVSGVGPAHSRTNTPSTHSTASSPKHSAHPLADEAFDNQHGTRSCSARSSSSSSGSPCSSAEDATTAPVRGTSHPSTRPGSRHSSSVSNHSHAGRPPPVPVHQRRSSTTSTSTTTHPNNNNSNDASTVAKHVDAAVAEPAALHEDTAHPNLAAPSSESEGQAIATAAPAVPAAEISAQSLLGKVTALATMLGRLRGAAADADDRVFSTSSGGRLESPPQGDDEAEQEA